MDNRDTTIRVWVFFKKKNDQTILHSETEICFHPPKYSIKFLNLGAYFESFLTKFSPFVEKS